MIGDRFIATGYQQITICKQVQQIANMNKATLIQDKTMRNDRKALSGAIILDYNRQNKKIEHIIRKHWPILLKDGELHKILSQRPQFIYKQAPNLRDRLVTNVIDPPKTNIPTFLDHKG